VPGHGLRIATQALEAPRPGRVGIGHGLQGGKGLGGDDEEGLCRVEIPRRLHKIGAVDVGYEAETERAVTVMFQRLVGHDRPQVRTPDANVHDGANFFPCVAFPFAASHFIREVGHLVEHGMHMGNHVLAIDQYGAVRRRPERHVQDSTLFGNVDFITTKHGLGLFFQARFPGKLKEQLQGLAGDSVLRVIKQKARCLDGHTAGPAGVIGEELPEMQFPGFLAVSIKGLP